MVFSKANRSIGIDLGSHSVKILELGKTLNGLRVERAALEPLKQEKYASDPQGALIDALQRAIRTFPLKGSIITSSLPGPEVIIRYLKLPKMPQSDLRGSIELEAPQYIPYDLADVNLDFHLLEEVTEGSEETFRVLLLAAKNEIIENHLDILYQAGIRPNIIGVTTLTLADAYEAMGGFQEKGTVALINIGASAIDIHFCRDGISTFTRDIARGGRELTTTLQKFFRTDLTEAERLKVSLQPKEQPQEGEEDKIAQAKKTLDPIIGRFINEISRSVDFYENQLFEKGIDKAVISGGTAYYPGLDKDLKEALKVEVEIADPLKVIECSAPEKDIGDLLHHGAEFFIALGLAYRGTEKL